MKQEDIVALLAEYESSHPVERYTAYGWYAWPVLRNLLGLRLAEVSDERRSEPSLSTLRKYLYYAQVAHRIGADSLRGLLRGKGGTRRVHQPSDRGGRNVVLLTNSNRALPKGDVLYNRIAEPVIEAFDECAQHSLLWERGAVRLPRRHALSRVDPALKIQYGLAKLRGRLPIRLPEPPWFAEYAQWASAALGWRIEWKTFADVRRVEAASRTFGRWLASSHCRLLLVDTWYGREPMAALLAARRLGIPTMDLQHGLHGFAYKGWTKKPPGGYEIFPDRFWVWGQDIAQGLLEANPGLLRPEEVFIGGNLWVNKWREPGDEDIQRQVDLAGAVTADSQRSILVTLQKNVELEGLLSRLIGDSPRDWLWLIRMRRHTTEGLAALEGRLRALGHPGVNVSEATKLPLYALLRAVGLHLTGYSTCALEALAFGVPTVLVHPTGQSLYQKYLEAGVMHYCAPEPEGVARGIQACFQVTRDQCRSVADAVFAPRAECQRNLKSLLVS